MDLDTFLTDTTLRLKKEEIAGIIGTSDKQYQQLISAALSKEMPNCWRAMWLADYLAELRPDLGEPYVEKLWGELSKKHPDGVVRSAMRMLTRYPIPEKHQGFAADLTVSLLVKEVVPVAIKVYAMEIMLNIAKIYPELKEEFITVIQDQILHGTSGYKARAKKILPKLEAL